MKTDQDLIFEAYAKTLNEGSHLYGDTELGPGKYKASDVTITDYDIEGLTPVGVGGGYENVPVEFEDDNGTTMTGIIDSLYIDDTGGLDASGMIYDAEVGTLEEDGESSVSKYYKQAYDYAKENPDVSSFEVNPYEEFSDEYLEFEDGFEDGLAQSGAGWSEEDYEDAAFGKLDDDLMPIKNKSGFENFYAEGESFADKLSDEGLEFAIKNLNQLKGILMDEFGYRRQAR